MDSPKNEATTDPLNSVAEKKALVANSGSNNNSDARPPADLSKDHDVGEKDVSVSGSGQGEERSEDDKEMMKDEDDNSEGDDVRENDDDESIDDDDDDKMEEEHGPTEASSPAMTDKENESSNDGSNNSSSKDPETAVQQESAPSLQAPYKSNPNSATTTRQRNQRSKEDEQALELRRQERREERQRRKLFQDCISISIPLDYTADLGVAVRHTRQKRILALWQAFPQLRPAKEKEDLKKKEINGDKNEEKEEEEESGKEDTGGETTGDEAKGSGVGKKRALDSIGSNRNNYSSIVDYLESKYVKGVMIDEDDGGDRKYDDDDKGSVYSESSFLDDTDLQRDVAEQVLANSTTTKMELVDDNEFFVNVGNLEVEETELTREQYDPLKDVDPSKLKKKKAASSAKKDGGVRKKPGPKPGTKKPAPTVAKKTPAAATATKKLTSSKPKAPPSPKNKGAASVTTTGSKKKAPSSTSSVGSGPAPKKKAKTSHDGTAAEPNSKSTTSTKAKSAPTTAKKKAEIKKLLKTEADRKSVMEKTYRILVGMIPQEDLPRRKTKEKVALTCPAERKPGDTILFENPHVKGQRLKVKIPKKTKPGDTFRVTVPVPQEDEGDSPPDHNKWTRDFYEVLSEYAYHFDAWIDSVSERHMSQGEEYPGHFEKRKKFDKLTGEFPKELKTPIDKSYLQKILRRARQNKHKRDKTAQRLKQEEEEQQKARAIKKEAPDKPTSSTASAGKTQPESSPKRVVKLPESGASFEERAWQLEPFLARETE